MNFSQLTSPSPLGPQRPEGHRYTLIRSAIGDGRWLPCTCSVTQWCPTLCDPVNCSLPGSSVHRISQAKILERVAISLGKAIFLQWGNPFSVLGMIWWLSIDWLCGRTLGIVHVSATHDHWTFTATWLLSPYAFRLNFISTCHSAVSENTYSSPLTWD